MNFKDQVARDLKAVFHNPGEHADLLEFRYDGKRFKAPVILDHTGAADRKKPGSDHAEGLYLVDLLMYVALADIKQVPRKDRTIEIGDDAYTIRKVEVEAGEVILHLEMYDE